MIPAGFSVRSEYGTKRKAGIYPASRLFPLNRQTGVHRVFACQILLCSESDPDAHSEVGEIPVLDVAKCEVVTNISQ